MSKTLIGLNSCLIDTTDANFSENVMKLFENVFNLHEKALQLREQHLEVISRNIANVDTPNFKARGIDFQDALQKALSDDDDEKQASDVYTLSLIHI